MQLAPNGAHVRHFDHMNACAVRPALRMISRFTQTLNQVGRIDADVDEFSHPRTALENVLIIRPDLLYDVFGLIVPEMLLAPEAEGLLDDRIEGVRDRYMTTQFTPSRAPRSGQ
jgi:hypothetical protein